MKKRILAVFLVMLVLSFAVLPAAAEQLISTNNFPDVLARVKKGVVQIYGVGYRSGQVYSAWTGSGFAVGKAGKDSDTFVTNWHCVTESGHYSVKNTRIFIMKEGCTIRSDGLPDPNRSVECEVLKTTSGYPDYAIIRAKTSVSGYKALPLLSADEVQDGAAVYAIGYPGEMDDVSATHSGIDDITSTDGIVSKHMVFTEAANTKVLLHTAVIAHGNSGGPLITAKGAAVGINTYGTANDADRYYAVYSDYVMAGLDDLKIEYDVYKEGMVIGSSELSTTAIVGIAVAVVALGAIAAYFVAAKKRKEAEAKRLEEEAKQREEAERHAAEERQEREYAARLAAERAAAARQAEEKRAAAAEPSGYSLMLPGNMVRPIPKTGMTIGRSRDCTLILPENTPGVSGHHCKLTFINGRLVVMDMGSTYGTLIHGQKIPANTPVALNAGSKFALGGAQNMITIVERR